MKQDWPSGPSEVWRVRWSHWQCWRALDARWGLGVSAGFWSRRLAASVLRKWSVATMKWCWMNHRESGHVLCPGWPLWCGKTRARTKAVGINIKKWYSIGRFQGRLPSHPDPPPKIGVAFEAEFLHWNKDFPGSFPRSSISVHFLALQPDWENWITKPRLLPIIPLSLLLQTPVPHTLRQAAA